mgnify:CR=1 FL=1
MKLKKGKSILLILFSFLAPFLYSQKTILTDEQTWFGIFNQNRFSDKWGTWTDIHYRLKNNFINDPSQFLIRVGPTYYLTDDVRLTVAYNFVNHFPDEMHPNESQIEHRPFQQIQWYTRFPHARLMQWVRLDERFRQNLNNGAVADGYNFNWRIRYNYALFLPLTKKGLNPGSFQAVLNNEIMFNFGKKIIYNSFDQNRLFAGFVYQFTKESHIQLGYMNVFQQQATGNKYKSIHAIRLFYLHNIDFRKK